MSPSFEREEVLASLPHGADAVVEAVLDAARARGASVLLVGGPVRDLLLGRAVRDVDLIVSLPDAPAERAAAEVAQGIAMSDLKRVEHGRFGTVRLEGPEASVDLASMRCERYERPGALPVVGPGDLEQDLLRRDFSINALALPLVAPDLAPGPLEVIDPIGGLADLAARKLRVLHPASFLDDPTRALRAARLAPRLDFSLSRGSRSALRDALRAGAFGAVSGDRLRRELEKCFSDADQGLDPARALRLLSDWHVLQALEPGLELPRTVSAPLRRAGRSFASPPWRTGRMRPWVTGLTIWLSALPPAMRPRVLRRFSVRGELTKRISAFPKRSAAWLEGLASARGRGAVDALLAGIEEEELHALHAIAEPALRRRIVRWAAEDRARRAPISGADLTDIGLTGPAVGRALSRVRAAYLDGEVANREEAIALARELGRRRGLGRAAPKAKRAAAHKPAREGRRAPKRD
jgi:tRNA nucleotidyltransferase (CCA-adding enzyme)